MPSIVQVNVTLTVAPTPATLQQTGAIVTQGGTLTSPWTATLLTQLADLTPVIAQPRNNTTLVWASNVVTVTTATAHGYPVGATLLITIAGATPSGYNGTFSATVTTATAFTYALSVNPGTETVPGTYITAAAAELTQMVTTYFAQGAQRAVYVLELGPDAVTGGIATLTAYLAANPNTSYVSGAAGYFYAYLIPREWDGVAQFLSLLQSFESTTSQTYFFITTTLATYTLYTALMKCAVTLIEAPVQNAYAANPLTAISWSGGVVTATTTSAHGVTPGSWFTLAGNTPSGYNGTFLALPGTTASTLVYALAVNPGTSSIVGTLLASYYASTGIGLVEFSMAALFHVALTYQPSTTNKVGPFAFQFLFGVTPFPTRGNNALLTILKAAFINVVGTGAEGGITNTITLWGTTMDGNDFTYWYSVDWVQININLDISNAIINGSNNPINPLYYNQQGIDRLQAVAANTMSRGVTFGLVLFTPIQVELDGPDLVLALNLGTYNGYTIVNAVPFIPYSRENPGDYKIGRYQGFSIQYTPSRGFINVIFNVNVSSFVVQ